MSARDSFMMTSACGPLFNRASCALPGKRKMRAAAKAPQALAGGWGLGYTLIIVDFAKVLNQGLNSIIREAESELKRCAISVLTISKRRSFSNR